MTEKDFVLIEASAGEMPRVLGVAYSGGPISLGGWTGEVVVDLEGLVIPSSVPLLANHENRTSSKVGEVVARVENGALEIEGKITSSNGYAQGIIEQAKAGARWQLSIGATAKEYRELAQGETVTVNAREIVGPVTVITHAHLREVSVVAVGADENTEMRIAAEWRLEANMSNGGQEDRPEENEIAEEETTMEEPKKDEVVVDAAAAIAEMRAEAKRISEVRAACDGYPEIEEKAVADGLSVVEAKAMILDSIEARKGTEIQAFHVNVGSGNVAQVDAVEAALAMNTGAIRTPEDHYSDQVLEAAGKMRGIGICEAMKVCAASEGKRVETGASVNVLAGTGFSTVSLPSMLGNIANKALQEAYSSVPGTIDMLFEQLTANDYKLHTGVRLGGLGTMETVPEGAAIKHGTMAEETFTYQVKTVGKIIGLTREMLKNDDLGGFVRLIRNLGLSAANTKEMLGWTLVLANTGNFFHATNNNYITDALDIDGISEAVETLMLQTGIDGTPIMVEGTYLVVPPQLAATARAIYSGSAVQGSTAKESNANIYQNTYLPVPVSYLGNSAMTGYSATAWYLWSQNLKPFGIAYLDGSRAPIIEEVDPGAEYLGRAWRAYMDFGVCQIDGRGAVKSAGTGS